MNKQEAADYLEISVRSLERATQQNRISVRYERGKTKPTPVYDVAELERFKREDLEKTVHKPVVRTMEENSPESANSQLATMTQSGGIEMLAKFLEAMQPGQQPSIADLAQQLTLTVDEAGRLSRLGKGAIEQAIKDGSLTAHYGRWRGRRIKRSELEAYIEQL
jgi:excisionase family DNA binding protein